MSKFTAQIIVGENDIVTYKASVGTLTDADINKPVKLSAADTVALCSAGDPIYGFINSVERHLADGKSLIGVQINGRKRVTLSGSAAVGTLVEAATNTAAGTALGQNWGIVQAKTAVSANVTTTATGTELSVAINALLAERLTAVKGWRVISGAGTTGTDAVVEKQ